MAVVMIEIAVIIMTMAVVMMTATMMMKRNITRHSTEGTMFA